MDTNRDGRRTERLNRELLIFLESSEGQQCLKAAQEFRRLCEENNVDPEGAFDGVAWNAPAWANAYALESSRIARQAGYDEGVQDGIKRLREAVDAAAELVAYRAGKHAEARGGR